MQKTGPTFIVHIYILLQLKGWTRPPNKGDRLMEEKIAVIKENNFGTLITAA